ncbi:MAG: LysR family transcriptional regulator [Pseudomonadales bacterium]|nr:LysR family transcriptional regulator [Pseudomonadales bacterium]
MNAQLNDWTDVHYAYQVARLGTLSAAALFLDVHHSTVLRRIEGLEKRLNARLFQRSPRGYTPTEAGLMLLKVAEQTENDFERLFGQLQGLDQQIHGTLIVTSVSSFSQQLIKILAEFQQRYPDLKIEYVEDTRLYKLEHGEAHVSIRPGAQPVDPDYVVQQLADLGATLFASKDYIKRYGKLKNLQDIDDHRFISTVRTLTNVPAMAWMNKHVPDSQIAFKTVDFIGMKLAAEQGVGIGVLSGWMAKESKALTALIPPPPEWRAKLWLITHRDVHRTSKVQLFTQFLKERLVFDE